LRQSTNCTDKALSSTEDLKLYNSQETFLPVDVKLYETFVGN